MHYEAKASFEMSPSSNTLGGGNASSPSSTQPGGEGNPTDYSPIRESTEMWGKQPPGHGICKARMLYDFEAAPGSQEVSAPAGLEFDVLEKQDDGWWKARVFLDGEWKEGYVPG
jgi:hypothetical protein